MEPTIAEKTQAFLALSVEKKQQHCLAILEGVKDQDPLFAELYDLVAAGNATDRDYQDIYTSALAVLNESETQKQEESVIKLEAIKNRLRTAKDEEHALAQVEKESSAAMLLSI